ncbi:alpha/beta fold hydrolase [Patescibacteria group bacterium]|nr:alpha/beta fold hydrolase [Patescibacteria group bacterium]
MMQISYIYIMIMKVGLVILLFFVIVSLYGFYIAIRPPKIHSPATPADFGLDFETITMETDDGVAIKGWFIPQPNTDKIIIALHGYPADKGDILPSLVFLHQDFNLLLFDFRYFGQSDGFYSTVGAREIYDLFAAVEFAKERGFTKIGIWGFSMGGAVALMGASKTSEIKAVVSDSSYASLSLLVKEPYRNLAFLKYPLAFFTGLWSKIFLGISIDEVSPAKKVMGMKIPILLIHSSGDKVIPFSHALLLKEALKDNPSAEFWFQEEIRHGEFQKEYEIRIREFFQRNL